LEVEVKGKMVTGFFFAFKVSWGSFMIFETTCPPFKQGLTIQNP
jgi:hypothetical protein